ncbi:MAG TPA: hypothetical protein VK797_30860 [Tepidisphaeraceae bacterium]|nr:hypothetical protein [Tepidisphaeraceae bacterium]
MAGSGAAIAVAWLFCGRWIAFVLDRCVPRRRSPMPHEPMLIAFDPEGLSSHFSLGPQGWPLSWPWRPWPSELKIITDEQGRLVFRTDERSFTFGPIRTRWNDPRKPQYEFVPEAGDVVSFTREMSRLPWPTPFEISWLGGASPKWKRLVYYRLRWNKSSGSVLEVLWRSEYWFYRRSGWADTWQNRLVRVRIRVSRAEKAVRLGSRSA